MAAKDQGSYEERECLRCFDGKEYDPERGAWVNCRTCSGTGRAHVFIYAKAPASLYECSGCGGRFAGRDLIEVTEDFRSLTFFDGDALCERCAMDHGVL